MKGRILLAHALQMGLMSLIKLVRAMNGNQWSMCCVCVCVCVCVYESRSKRASVGHTPANERCRPLLTPLIVCDRQGEMFDE